ncbi:MAG: hypothetical protein C4538_04460 [Nitrospiraceae bacterium]|nr:MAG: hypothetical protein C4538_04460 [Nitrospiraceae bacterium]
MNISDYIIQLESLINSSSAVSAYNLTIDRKTEDIAFISGNIEFRDGSVLDFKEFCESTEHGIERYKYAYNYRLSSDILFRYDNAPDPNAKELKTFPHHKHLRNNEIVESMQVELKDVLEEIEGTYIVKGE